MAELKALEKQYNFLMEDEQKNDTVAELSRRLELLRDATPFRVVEMALEIQVERLRVVEATQARDAAANRLLEAYTTVRGYSEFIDQLQREREEQGLERLEYPVPKPMEHSECALKARIAELETMVEEFREVNHCLKEYGSYERKLLCDPPPHYEDEITRASTAVQTEAPAQEAAADCPLPMTFCDSHPQLCKSMSAKAVDIVDLIRARNELLANIPLPENAPDMTLVPITLPPQVTLHEFLNGAPASLRTELGNYRVFHNTTTNWCPDREEHGFMYAPMFKCSTNPRALTAHRWSSVDVIGRMSKATECFYNNEGTWYYAGCYKAFLLDVVSTKEWDQLSSETTSALIKETLAGRKNTTPQNNYETGQLYAAGALKLACIALQCVGFNLEVYHSVSDLATRFVQTKWKPAVTANTNNLGMSPSAGSTSSSTIGTPSISSNANGFSSISPNGSIGHHTLGHGLCHSSHPHGHGASALLPHGQTKINSPFSAHGGSGPGTPNLPNSGLSTPGVSPGGSSHGSGIGGLGSGSHSWNVAANKPKSQGPTMGLLSTTTLGLQLSNINLSPGTSSNTHGFMHLPHVHPRAGHATLTTLPEFVPSSGNNENTPPDIIGSGLGSVASGQIGGQNDPFGAGTAMKKKNGQQ
ncbi:hypothetical protein DFP72DRAFT_176996 [Ephemerocybe angulata]|uniref:DUF6697 domain-containing protein n=1 Tax=Ephemerocybe angulata TaxID=980116 RepID=A0A8H6I779_9AGAR|nr:hypothetical protein DFP72DRAFT_176996 [Tulosesus angulatus]